MTMDTLLRSLFDKQDMGIMYHVCTLPQYTPPDYTGTTVLTGGFQFITTVGTLLQVVLPQVDTFLADTLWNYSTCKATLVERVDGLWRQRCVGVVLMMKQIEECTPDMWMRVSLITRRG